MNMKALGITRKIDQVGRIVIPKEIRKTLDWKTGDPMELFVSGNKLILQSYEEARKRGEMISSLKQIQQSVSDSNEQDKLEKVIDFLRK